ncbi:dicarboxylate/amino acid:cation symporter [Carnobacterium sp. CS13]|uniref:dicarboxylate/amino acid:cation symporter n=1 Tax=Carnobacterium sp. CS13 TaxID=2800128 RepID=UPI0019139E89|nr:dicarboxylate/amino acid:cation symporter [Carnobacterium sp. CS13]QQP69435.1 dicarboxylate/amino acid:cation symporter [Carnobacterium sp. CS13]
MKFLKNISMTNQIMIGMVLGILAGLLIGPAIAPIKIFGDIFLRLIQMSVVVLVMGAVIEAVGSLDSREIGKLGIKITAWFMGSTLVAAALGIVLGYLIKPGTGINVQLESSAIESNTDSLYDIILNFFPANVMESMSSANMIQVIIFSLLFGFSISVLSTKTDLSALMGGIKQFNVVILNIVKVVMKMAPLGIFSLIAWVTGTIGLAVILPLAKFLLAMAIGTVIFMFLWIMLTATYVKVNPLMLAKKLWRMTVVAFTTTSSAITLPVKMEDSEKKLGISPRISRLVGPLGMALNSNGLALYLSLAAITLAQFYSIEFTVLDTIQMVVLSTLACLGTVVVPGGGLVALAIVIPSLGLPLESIALLAGIDWFSGMFRTVLNVDADALIAMILAHDEKEIDYAIFNSTTEVSSESN